MSLTGIYDFFSRRRGVRRVSLALLTALLAGLLSLLHFSEDISDFLPLGTREREQLSVYQRISGADRLYLLFSNPGDADETIEAIDSFLEIVAEKDTEHWCDRITAQIDMETIQAVSDFVYDNAPYFTTASDIERMDSLLSQPDYIRTVLARDRQDSKTFKADVTLADGCLVATLVPQKKELKRMWTKLVLYYDRSTMAAKRFEMHEASGDRTAITFTDIKYAFSE